MIRMFLLWLSLLVSIAYLAFPNSGAVDFPFSDQEVTIQTWVWMLGEHVGGGGMLVAIYIVMTEPKYRLCAWTFFAICFVDTVDYMLTYSEPWGSNKVVTFNSMKCIIFVLVMFLDYKNHVGHTQRN